MSAPKLRAPFQQVPWHPKKPRPATSLMGAQVVSAFLGSSPTSQLQGFSLKLLNTMKALPQTAQNNRAVEFASKL